MTEWFESIVFCRRQTRWFILQGGGGLLGKGSERMSGSERGCSSWTTVHTALGTTPKAQAFQKKRIYFYLFRIPFHCVSNVWRKDSKEMKTERPCCPKFMARHSWNTTDWALDTEPESLGCWACALTFMSCGKITGQSPRFPSHLQKMVSDIQLKNGHRN